jgi:hypothetical protein
MMTKMKRALMKRMQGREESALSLRRRKVGAPLPE